MVSRCCRSIDCRRRRAGLEMTREMKDESQVTIGNGSDLAGDRSVLKERPDNCVPPELQAGGRRRVRERVSLLGTPWNCIEKKMVRRIDQSNSRSPGSPSGANRLYIGCCIADQNDTISSQFPRAFDVRLMNHVVSRESQCLRGFDLPPDDRRLPRSIE